MTNVVDEVKNMLPAEHKRLAREMTNIVFAALWKVLEREGKARVNGFGTFTMKVVPPRKARNPKTGEEIMTAPVRRVTVSLASNLRGVPGALEDN